MAVKRITFDTITAEKAESEGAFKSESEILVIIFLMILIK